MLEVIGITIATLMVAAALFGLSHCVVYIPNDKIGIVEKKWSGRGSVASGFVALHGEAGFQPDVLRGGFHLFAPFQYRVHRQNLVTIQQGTLAYVFARDGLPMATSQNLGCNKAAADFTDTAGFLANGGQKGLQRKILREGIYAINLAQFVVLAEGQVYALALPGDGNVDAKGAISGILAAVHNDLVARGGFRPLVIAKTGSPSSRRTKASRCPRARSWRPAWAPIRRTPCTITTISRTRKPSSMPAASKAASCTCWSKARIT
jgi:hypothetical protein